MHFGDNVNIARVFANKYKDTYPSTKILTIDKINSIVM